LFKFKLTVDKSIIFLLKAPMYLTKWKYYELRLVAGYCSIMLQDESVSAFPLFLFFSTS
jgi:hypothetical protein